MIILTIFMAFCLGIIVSGAIFSFIAMIGIVPRMAQKTKTKKYIKFYEESIIFGGVWGATTIMIPYNLTVPPIFIMIWFLCSGIFIGSIAVSLTEVLDVIPIIARRTKAQLGIKFFMLSIALGKGLGTFFYFLLDLE